MFLIITELETKIEKLYLPFSYAKLFDNLPNLNAYFWIKPGGRLVEENDLRFPDKAHSEIESAAHGTRIGRYPAGTQ